MRLFSNSAKSYMGISELQESTFAFLNRSGRPAAVRVRQALESWFEHYPADAKRDLKTRFRTSFDSAFFELLIHEYLTKVFQQVECHPRIGSKGRNPDFLCTLRTGRQVAVEAVVSSNKTDEETKRESIANRILDEMNKVQSPYFNFYVERITNKSRQQPSAARLRAFIESEVSRYDPVEVQAGLESGRDFPQLTYAAKGIEVVIELLPRSGKARRDGADPPIGIHPIEVAFVSKSEALKSALNRKASRYGTLCVPYVIAVNSTSRWGSSPNDASNALFGSARSDNMAMGTTRPSNGSSNGLWNGPHGAQNKRVSSVIFAVVYPWNVPIADFVMFHNPDAMYSCTDIPWRIPASTPGETLGSVLGLPRDWPGTLFDEGDEA